MGTQSAYIRGNLPGEFRAIYKDIEIRGKKDFVQYSIQVLEKLIKQSSAFSIVKPFIGRIREFSKSGMNLWDNVPSFEVSRITAYHSEIWYAGCIAHDGYHSLLYHEAKQTNGCEPPYSAYAGAQAEMVCIAYQIRVLKEMKAPPTTVYHLEQVIKDPQYQNIPYDNRWW